MGFIFFLGHPIHVLETIFNKVCERVSDTQEHPGTEVIKHFTCSTELSMKFIIAHNVKMPTSERSFSIFKLS